jgi:hypothetical protein
MITICYSNQRARQYSWLYHTFGWIVPICLSLIIYFYSSIDRSKEEPILGAEKFGKIQIILSIILLVLCIIINSISLLRMARRTYRLRHDLNEHRVDNTDNTSIINEVQPLIDGDQTDIESAPIGCFSILFYLK